MRTYVFLTSAVLLMAWLSACSVKENRVPCPAYLRVTFEEPGLSADTHVNFLGWQDGGREVVRKDNVPAADCDPYWVTAVHHEAFHFSCYRSQMVSAQGGVEYRIAYGNQCDSVYAYRSDIDLRTLDMWDETVSFKKQFATVYVDILKDEAVMEDFLFVVDGTSEGFNVITFAPVPGTFHYEGRVVGGERLFRFRIPRQAGDDMTLAVIYQEGASIAFPIGEYFTQLGYDWSAPALEDIFITIDYRLGLVTVRVRDWEYGAIIPSVML